MKLIAVALCLSACSFDEAGAGGFGASGGSGGTGGTGCAHSCNQLRAEIRVNGTMWKSNTMPAVSEIVGDAISLDADEVCTASGQAVLTWSITPQNGTSSTITPSPSATSIGLYATDPADYHVTLRITDPSCTQSAPFDVTVFALTATGPQAIAPNTISPGANSINKIAAGFGKLWAATTDGAWRIDLSPPHMPWEDVSSVYPSGSGLVQLNLATVFFDAADAIVWYAAAIAEPEVNQIPIGGTSIDRVSVLGASSGRSLMVTGFSRGAQTVHLASDRGIMDWNGGTAFINLRQVGNDALAAITEMPGQPLWAGGQALDNFSTIPVTSLDVFPGGDDKIRALALDGSHLWIGSDGFGLARANPSTGIVDDRLTMMTRVPKNLPGDRIRDLAVDGQDVWMATDQGIARYKPDAGSVIAYKQSAPGSNLVGPALDTRGIVVDRSTGVRRVFAGTAAGVLVLEAAP